MEAAKRLKAALTAAERRKHPQYPEHLQIPIKMPASLTTANGLQNAIVRWCQAHGYQAERVNVMGIPIDNRKIVTDVVGFQRQIGSIEYRPSGSTKGSADVHASLPLRGSNGYAVSCKFEVKIGKDRQSEYQKGYEQDVINSGGVYILIRTLNDFLEWWDNNIAI